MNRKTTYYGITPPVSTKGPDQLEIVSSEKLVEELAKHGQYESPEDAQQRFLFLTRQVVLGKINDLFKEFVKAASIRNGLPQQLAQDVGGKIFTFGSYRLGVHGKGSDIDTLCVAPKYVKREDFLEHMYETLKNRPEVTEITVVPEAFVPIIKLIFSDFHVRIVNYRLI
jgi:poly(A) polymerase